MNLARGKLDSTMVPVAGQLAVVKGKFLAGAIRAGELLRKTNQSSVVGLVKLPPEVAHLLEQASGSAVEAFRREEETLAPVLRCMQHPEAKTTMAQCLQDTGLFQGIDPCIGQRGLQEIVGAHHTLSVLVQNGQKWLSARFLANA